MVLDKEKVVHAVYGNNIDKRVLLYTLSLSETIPEAPEPEEAEAEEYVKPLDLPKKTAGKLKLKTKMPKLRVE